MADLAAAGGKKYAEAIGTARDSVARLEVAVEAVQARGGPVTPAMTAELLLYDAAVQAAAASTEKAAGSTKLMSAEVGVARGNVGGLANAMKGLGGAVGGTVVGFLVFEGLFKLLPQLIKSVEDAGTALGNMYARLTGGVVEHTKAEEKLNAELVKQDQAAKKAADAHDVLLRAQIAAAGGAIKFTSDQKALVAEFLAYDAKLHGTIEVTDDYKKAMKDLGIVIPETLTHLSADANALALNYDRIFKVEGPLAAQRFIDANVSMVDKTLAGFKQLGVQVPPEFQRVISAMTALTQAQKDAAADTKLRDHFNEISEAITYAVGRYGDMSVAVKALKPDIAKQIQDLEDLKGKQGALTKEQEHELQTLKDWEKQAGITHTARGALIAKVNDLVKAYADEANQIEKLTQKYADSKESIEGRRKAAVEAAEDGARAVSKGAGDEIASLEKRYRSGTIDAETYGKDVARIQMDQVNARRKAEADEDAINKDAEKSQDDLKKNFDEASTKLSEKMKEQGADIKDLKKVRDELTTANKDGNDAILKEAEAHSRVIEVITPSKKAHTDMKEAVKTLTDHIRDDHTPALDNLHQTHTGKLHSSVPKTTGAHAELGTQFGVTSEAIPPLIANLDALETKLNAVTTAANNAATATANLAGGGGGGDAGGGGGGEG